MRAALGLALSGLLALAGCAAQQGAKPSSSGPVYERYKNLGELPVQGASVGDPGPRVFASVTSVPRLRTFLGEQGTPDSLEVLEPAGEALRIHLNYKRNGRRIVLERVDGRLSAYAPTRLDGSPLGRRPPPPTDPAQPPPPVEEEVVTEAVDETPALPGDASMPTELQALECPIDPERVDCARLCVPGARHEWCR